MTFQAWIGIDYGSCRPLRAVAGDNTIAFKPGIIEGDGMAAADGPMQEVAR